MIITERDLQRIIRQALMEDGRNLGDVIDNFEEEIVDAIDNRNVDGAIKNIKVNNALFEIILGFLEKKSSDFKEFYQKSGFDSNDKDFLKQQESYRTRDYNQMKNILEKFFEAIRKTPLDQDTFKNQLETLSRRIKGYRARWYPIQFLFFNLNSGDITKELEIFIAKAENWITPPTDKKYIQIPVQGKSATMINAIVKICNAEGLSTEVMSEILKENASSDEFEQETASGNWSFLTSLLDDAYSFLFANSEFRFNGRFSTSMKSFFQNADNQFGLSAKLQKKFNEIGKDDVKKYLNDPNSMIGKVIAQLGSKGGVSADDYLKAMDEISKLRK